LERAQKAQEVAHLNERLSKAQATFLVDFKGLNVEQVTNLRKTLRPKEAEMRVVRNTLARRAIEDLPEVKDALSEHLVGTNAFVFAFGEAPDAAKAIVDFGKAHEHLKVKCGVFDGSALDANRVQQLASLPSKDALRGMLLGVFAAPMTKFVRTLNEPASAFVRVLNAKKENA
jgi:large subunit ribosomal protein L10